MTIDQLFQAYPVHLPGMLDPPEAIAPTPIQGKRGRKRAEGQTEMLFPIEGKPAGEDKAKAKGNRSIRPITIEVTRSDNRKAKAGLWLFRTPPASKAF
ncbi:MULTISPECIES: hypothetical protein [Mesorhizobium]|uniref:hypothetical protein n=1 Tax=Mesorhizobium TaxID=68287 RepID=UPI0009EECAE9|nr:MULTISPECIES: hypothetical protein [Mesorhizobium]MUT27366.1 hypothetical protein [Mesorhizobium japonicum]